MQFRIIKHSTGAIIKVYIALFDETENHLEPFRKFFTSKKELGRWTKKNYDGDEEDLHVSVTNIPLTKKGVINFLNVYCGEGGDG